MTIPTPLTPTKGAGTTLWVYTGKGNPFANPLDDVDWTRLAKIKDLTPGELTAESYDDTYLDDEDADWKSTAQGEKSAGETSYTLAWKPGESGQQELVRWFNDGTVLAYKIRYPNGVVDVFRGWVSSLGKTIPAKEVITRAVKITNNGKPQLAEDSTTPPVPVTGITMDQTSATVAKGASLPLTVTVLPANASDVSFRAASSDLTKAKISVKDNVITVSGVAAGDAEIVAMTSDGKFVALCEVVVS
ncbi:TPA: phage tail protein [Salmonella enterica]|uniref:Phage tail protein n=7 Tax=Salmonella enterica TaxID=28901 RepID=A0A6C8Y5U3_SALER|nr:phage tail protein [Salmonella enterica]EAA4186308.1 phage tail protein [Salmonella enterica subsp. enterica serovar Mikawasima]EAA4371775.1 phage tail protein [Salmonella enterica subsp. enterica serovar Abony]EAA9532583.1 phage tail protein [Salmonella enterica subsp. enterica serovar Vitkin]EAB6843193.1 phage tail protein [Salmonella enterica subsp. salamae]EAB6966727.1 phage tail protein [Salmonella enterica subsp. enterica serovar Kottbus]EAC0379096.1 phage tail protein [Salmonella en